MSNAKGLNRHCSLPQIEPIAIARQGHCVYRHRTIGRN